MIGCACDCWGPHLVWDCRYEFVFPDDRFTGARCMKYMHYAWRIIPPYWFRSFDPSSRLCSSSIVMAVTSICIFFSSSFPITRLSFSPFFCCFLITFFFFWRNSHFFFSSHFLNQYSLPLVRGYPIPTWGSVHKIMCTISAGDWL